MLSKYLSPRNDAAFKKIFNEESNKDILMHFLNDLLPLAAPIRNVSFLKTVQNAELAALRESLVDAMCEDENGERFIVEMQVAHEKRYDKRALYYAARTYCSQRVTDVEYKDLKTVYFLAITGFRPFPHKEDWFSHIGLMDLNTQEHDIESIQLFFIQLPLFTKTKEDLHTMTIREKWAYFFKYADETTEEELDALIGSDIIIKRAYDELDRFQWSQDELRLYDSVDMKICSNQAVMEAAEEKGEARGITIGEARGITIGEARGITIGEARGEERGRREQCLAFATRMIKKGCPIQEIVEDTGLSEEAVAQLHKETLISSIGPRSSEDL